MKKLYAPLIIILSVIIADQGSKIWALNALDYNMPVEVIGRFFMFTLIYNEGGALGTSFGPSAYYLISSSLILLFVLYYLYLNRGQKALAWPLAFIAGGAIGNLIDRIRFSKVIDFIDVDFFDINLFGYRLERWWTFNIADSAILLSILFLIYLMLFKKEIFAPMVGTNEKKDSNQLENSNNTAP